MGDFCHYGFYGSFVLSSLYDRDAAGRSSDGGRSALSVSAAVRIASGILCPFFNGNTDDAVSEVQEALVDAAYLICGICIFCI